MTHARPWEHIYPSALRDYVLDVASLPDPSEFSSRAACAFGDRPAFSVVLPNGSGATLTFEQVDALASAFASFLVGDLGLTCGSVVALQLPNGLHYPVAVLGAWKAGLIVTLINPLYTAREVERQLRDSCAQVLVAHELCLGAAAIAKEHGVFLLVAGASDFFPREGTESMLSADQRSPTPDGLPRFVDACAPRPALAARRHPVVLYQYTGGTTGRSKAAIITCDNIVATLKMVSDFLEALSEAPTPRAVLTPLPLYHIFAFVLGFLLHYRSGAHNILIPNPRPVENLRPAFERFHIDCMAGVDTLYTALVAEPWFREHPPTLQYALTGGSAIRPSTVRDWEALVCPMVEGYGLTESTCIVATNPANALRRPGTVGVPLPGCEIRIVTEAGAEAGPMEAGELLIRGPQVVSAYLDMPEENEAAFSDGWFRTGDVARLRADGFIEIIDRKKDMVLVSGFNVYPNEVEAVIGAHPDVAEVAVVGRPDEKTGEAVRAFVVAKSAGLKTGDIIQHCRRSLAGYKVPKDIIFRTDLPKTPVGKVLRSQLRNEEA